MSFAVDATLVSPLHADGTAWDGANLTPSISFRKATRSKTATYPKLVDCSALQLITASSEIGGRLSSECLELISAATKHRSRDDPLPIRGQAERMWRSRWFCMLSVVIQRVVAASLVREGGLKTQDAIPGAEPCSVDVWLGGQL